MQVDVFHLGALEEILYAQTTKDSFDFAVLDPLYDGHTTREAEKLFKRLIEVLNTVCLYPFTLYPVLPRQRSWLAGQPLS